MTQNYNLKKWLQNIQFAPYMEAFLNQVVVIHICFI